MLDEQAAHAELDPIALVGGDAPLPERLRDDAEHRAAVELLAAGLDRVDAQAADVARVSTRRLTESCACVSSVDGVWQRRRPARRLRLRRRGVAEQTLEIVERRRSRDRARRPAVEAAPAPSRGVAAGAVARVVLDAVIVPRPQSRLRRRSCGSKLARQPHRAERASRERPPRRALDLRRHEAPVEPRVVRDEHVSLEHAEQLIADLGETRRVLRPSSHVMFVSAVTIGGIGRSGLTSVSNTSSATPSRTTTTAISVMRSPAPAREPVVSTSTTTNDSCRSAGERRDDAVVPAPTSHRAATSDHRGIARESRCPANSAAAMCSATLARRAGSWQTCEISDCAIRRARARESRRRAR